jgi:hypothetical protein
MTSLLANQAIDLAIAAVISAFAVLVTSVAGYIQLRGKQIATAEKVQAVKENVQQVQEQVAGAGAHPLLGLNPVNQRTAVTVSPTAAVTGNWDCGLACVVSVIAEIKRTWSADQLLRLRYFGVVDSRLTTADDIVGMLNANDIPAHGRNVDAATARIEIVRNWQANRSSIVLGDWISLGYPHWMRFRGDDGGAEFMDPWIGGARRLTWEQFSALYDGWYVHIDAAPPPALCGSAA